MHTPTDIFVQRILRFAMGALVGIGMLSAGLRPIAAQRIESQKPPASPATKKSSAGRPASPPVVQRAPQPAPRAAKPTQEASPEPTLSSSAASQTLLTGDEWHDTLLRFEQWLSVQTLYDAEQVAQMRAKYAARAKAIAPADRKQFVKNIDAKLDILYSPDTSRLENYFAESLAAAAPAYAKKTRQQLPDVIGSAPQQLRERLARIAMKYHSTAEVYQAFEQTRQQQLSSRKAQSDWRRFEQARPSAGQVAASSSGGSQHSNGGFTKARDYFPQSNSSITYSVIPAMPMMTTGGWAMFGGGVAISIQRNR